MSKNRQKKQLSRLSQKTAPNRLLVFTGIVLVVAIGGYFFIYSAAYPELDRLPSPSLEKVEPFVAEKIRLLIADVKNQPKSTETWGKLAMNLDVHDFKLESMLCYQMAIELAPSDFRWHYYLAIVSQESGVKDALVFFEQARKIKPDYAPLLYRNGKAFFEAGNLAKAESLYTQATQSSSAAASAYAYWGLAEIELAKYNLSESKRLLLKAVEQNPDNREIHSLLASVYARLGEMDNAHLEREQLNLLPERVPIPDQYIDQLEAEGVSAYWFGQHGRRYLDQGNYPAALEAFQMELRIKPSADAHNSLGMTYQYLGQHPTAAQHFREAILQKPEYAEAYNNLAITLYSLEKIQSAMDSLNRAIVIKPKYSEPYLNLGTFELIAGHTEAAMKIFDIAMQTADYDIRIAGRLAWILATSSKSDLRDGKKAIELAESVCMKTGYRQPEYLDILAAAYAEAGYFKKAVEIAQQGLQSAELEKKQQLFRQIQFRLGMYKKNKPFRDSGL